MKRLAVLLLASCCSTTPAPVAPARLNDTPNCAAACSHLEQLGCEEGKPLEDGTTCTKFCEDTQTSGHALNATCVMLISACAELGSKCGG